MNPSRSFRIAVILQWVVAGLFVLFCWLLVSINFLAMNVDNEESFSDGLWLRVAYMILPCICVITTALLLGMRKKIGWWMSVAMDITFGVLAAVLANQDLSRLGSGRDAVELHVHQSELLINLSVLLLCATVLYLIANKSSRTLFE
jgi:hypothetical protein